MTLEGVWHACSSLLGNCWALASSILEAEVGLLAFLCQSTFFFEPFVQEYAVK